MEQTQLKLQLWICTFLLKSMNVFCSNVWLLSQETGGGAEAGIV
jgi:hypothetical protein